MLKTKLSVALATVLIAGGGLYANDEVKLDTIEINADSIGYSDVDSLKISSKNAGAIRDVMRDIPGVYVAGTNQLNQKLYMRGVNDRGINITVDGARQRGNVFHHSADLILDVDLLKAVNVGVGVLSVANNSGALGGSVAFKTVNAFDLLDGDENFGGKFKTSYASNNKEWQKSLMIYGKNDDNFGLLAYINHKNYDFGKDGNGNEIGGKGQDLSYLLKVNYDKDDHKAGVSYEHTEYKGRFPFRGEFGGSVAVDTGTLKAGERAQPIIPQRMPRDTYTINYNYNPNEYVDLEARAYYTEHRIIKEKIPSIKELKKMNPKMLSDDGVRTIGAYLNNKTILEHDNFSEELFYGFEWYQTKSFRKMHAIMQFGELEYETKDKSGNPEITKEPALGVFKSPKAPSEVANNYSVFLQDTLKFGGLSVIPGVRFDRFSIDNFGRKTQTFNNVSPALALDYKFDMGLNLFAGYSKVFRGPDPLESLFLSSDSKDKLIIDDDLKPETGNAYEGGIGFKNTFDDHRVSFVTKYFHTDYKNLIKEHTKIGLLRYNTGKSTVSGVEVYASYGYEDFKVSASYTHQKTKHKDIKKVKVKGKDVEVFGGVMAYSDSGDKYTLNVEYFTSPIDTLFGYNLIAFAGKKLDDGTKKSGYAVSEIYANYMPSFNPNLEINFTVSNLFDKTYVSHSQKNFTSETMQDYEAGRNIKLGFSYKF